MKRLNFVVVITILLASALSAQGFNRGRNDVKPVTVEGTLKIERGIISLVSGDTVYFVPMLTRYIGFIDGLKEDAKATIEGFTARNFLHPTKVTINGKAYDFNMGNFGQNFMNGNGNRERFSRGNNPMGGRNGFNNRNKFSFGRHRGNCCRY
jgi:hypothetical protein